MVVGDGAKMGQTVRLTMPFNAIHAFMHVSGKRVETHKHEGLRISDRNTPAQLAYRQLRCDRVLSAKSSRRTTNLVRPEDQDLRLAQNPSFANFPSPVLPKLSFSILCSNAHTLGFQVIGYP